MGRAQGVGKKKNSSAERPRLKPEEAAGGSPAAELRGGPVAQVPTEAGHDSQGTESQEVFGAHGGYDDGAGDGGDLRVMDQHAAAAYRRYNPLDVPDSGPGGPTEGGRANAKKPANTRANTASTTPPLPSLNLEGLLPDGGGGRGGGAAKVNGRGGGKGGGAQAKGLTVDKGHTPALSGLGLPGPGQLKQGLLSQGNKGTPTLDDLRAFVKQTISRVSNRLDQSFKEQMTDAYTTEAQRLHKNAKQHYDQVAASLKNTQAAVQQAQEQHLKAKEAVRMTRDEAAARAEDVQELRTALQDIKTKAEDQIIRLRKKHKLA